MFQIGDLVKYDTNSRWRTSRTDEYEENEKTGIIMSITAFKDITQSEVQVHVQWNGGQQKNYLAEELELLSQNENENENENS